MAKITYFGTDSLLKTRPHGRGLTVTKKTLTTQFDAIVPKDTTLRGYLIQGSQKALDAWLLPRMILEPKDFMLLRDGTDCKLLVNTLTGSMGVVIEDKTGFLKDVPEVKEELERILQPLSGATNRFMRVSFFNQPQTPPPTKAQTSLIDIVVGASPLGVSDELQSTSLSGVRLHAHGQYVNHQGPAMGRGIILKDEQGSSYAQVVNGVIYLLLPTGTKQAFQLLDSKSGPGLFKRAFIPAWNAFIAPTALQRPKRHVLPTEESIAVYSKEAVETQDRARETLLAIQRTRVDKALNNYLDALRELENIKVFTTAAKARVASDTEKVAEDWKKLLNHPQIAHIYAEDEAIYVETRMLHLEHKGVWYRLGAFVLRISFVDNVGIWSKKSVHRDGITHPHISGEGSICFGNVTRSIHEDIVQCRIGSAVETILRWLTDGYDPVRADTKIEEWPKLQRKPA